MNGSVVHDWHLPFSEVWDETAAVGKPDSYSKISVRNTFLFPNGDLLAIYVGFGTPWGQGIVKMNKDSELIWKYLEQVHHDLDVGEDGRIYVLTHKIETETRPGLEQFEPPIIDDRLAILSEDGEELKSISILEAFRDSPFANVLDLQNSYTSKGDVSHANGVEVVRPSLADEFPMAEEGQVLLSFREIDAIALLDPDTEQIVWALRGPWHHQHDPDLLDNGNILIFDNEGDLSRGGLSRILEFNPSTLEVVWSYDSQVDEIFCSQVRGTQQRLPNGNTLITESENGRLIEVTPDKNIAWEYYIPFVGENDGELVKIVYPSPRYAPQDLAFDFNGPTRWNGN